MRVRLPRVRVTVRGLMVLVAVVSLTIWGLRMANLSAEYRARARDMKLKAELEEFESAFYVRPEGHPSKAGDDRVFAWHKRLAGHYLALARKYQRASRQPWLPVEPDPPSPSWVPE